MTLTPARTWPLFSERDPSPDIYGEEGTDQLHEDLMLCGLGCIEALYLSWGCKVCAPCD